MARYITESNKLLMLTPSLPKWKRGLTKYVLTLTTPDMLTWKTRIMTKHLQSVQWNSQRRSLSSCSCCQRVLRAA